MQHSQFTVAGMSSSTSSHHNPNLNSWGSTSTSGPLASTFGDHSLSQSRSHYQSGYLMSSTQNNNIPQGSQRVDDVPMVQTKAKLNHIASRGSAADFGMDSMFQSSRQRQTLADEDAPPTTSIHDIPNQVISDTPDRFQPRRERNVFSMSSRHGPPATSNSAQRPEPLYIVVFGYPLDKYSITLEYFQSLGDATEGDPNADIVNCFRIGYYDPGDAMRAVRKNGEVIAGSYMVGAKWADPIQAEMVIGRSAARSAFASAAPQNNFTSPPPSAVDRSNAMAVDEPQTPAPRVPGGSGSPVLGTPLKLAPSMAAFRRGGSGSKPATPQQAGWSGGILLSSVSAPVVQPSPSKGVMGQVSDLIFGW